MEEFKQLRNCYLNVGKVWNEMGDLYFKTIAQEYINKIGYYCTPQTAPVILPIDGQLIDGEINGITLNESNGEITVSLTILNVDTMEEINNIYVEDCYGLSNGDIADILFNELIENNENLHKEIQ